MSYGVEVRNAKGEPVLTSDMFTVRMVDRFTVTEGPSTGEQTIARPRVKAGMFCVSQRPLGDANITLAFLPYGTALNGSVRLRPTLPNSTITYPYEVLVLANV